MLSQGGKCLTTPQLSPSRADVAHWKIELHLTIPRIEVKGQYEVTGNVLLFPVRSRGDFWAAFSTFDLFFISQVEQVVNSDVGVFVYADSRMSVAY